MRGLEIIMTWTLIHSLWIALGVWILVNLLSFLLKQSKYRRVMKIWGVSIFLVLTIATLFWKSPLPITQQGSGLVESQPVYFHSPTTLTEQVKLWVSDNSLLINIIWLTGIGIGIVRFMANRNKLHQCKASAIEVHDEATLGKVKEIRNALKLSRSVKLMVSSLVNSPMTIGTLKPIIYFPTGLISGFSSEELDAIIRHELMHIKHNDYLVNAILVGLETLFFFNPFLIMIIRGLRREMEYACDDEVIEVHDELAYSRALMRLQEISISNQVAMAAKGNNSEFKNRIERMIYPKKTNISPKVGIITLLLTATIISSAFVGKASAVPETIEVTPQDNKQDTLKAASWDEIKRYLAGKDSAELAKVVIMKDGKPVKFVRGVNNALAKSKKMMEEVQRELVKDGILNENKTKITLMFQYSDVLQGEKTLGKHYEKYKGILNKYFPVYDSFATTRVFRYKPNGN